MCTHIVSFMSYQKCGYSSVTCMLSDAAWVDRKMPGRFAVSQDEQAAFSSAGEWLTISNAPRIMPHNTLQYISPE